MVATTITAMTAAQWIKNMFLIRGQFSPIIKSYTDVAHLCPYSSIPPRDTDLSKKQTTWRWAKGKR